MTNRWRPPVTPTERSLRAIRSMQNGSVDGRIVSARKAPASQIVEQYVDDDDDTGDVTGTDGGGNPIAKPWTDYFSPDGSETHYSWVLTHVPWEQTQMPASLRNRASVHIYWNGVFQQDLSYELIGKYLFISDPKKLFRSGDKITVKYWYAKTTSGYPGDKVTAYQLECWLTMTSGESWASVGRTLVSGGIGNNSGVIAYGTTYKTKKFRGSWSYRFRLPSGVVLPTHDGVIDIQWRFSFDAAASASLGTLDWSHSGGGSGAIYCLNTCCFLQKTGCGECPPAPSNSPSQQDTSNGAGATYGPMGGALVAFGDRGISYAEFLNGYDSAGVHRSDIASLTDPTGGSFSIGCHLVPELGDHFEDTVWGASAEHMAVYRNIGMTAYVIERDD